jgi:hypothetical protein
VAKSGRAGASILPNFHHLAAMLIPKSRISGVAPVSSWLRLGCSFSPNPRSQDASSNTSPAATSDQLATSRLGSFIAISPAYEP